MRITVSTTVVSLLLGAFACAHDDPSASGPLESGPLRPTPDGSAEARDAGPESRDGAAPTDADSAAPATCARTLDAADERVVRASAQAILDRQIPGGAIFVGLKTLPDNKLVPYFANLAARSLCLASCAVDDGSYLAAARQWLDWYAAHMNANGTVYDYTSTSGTLASTGDFDSTDSYGATFVDAVRVCDAASPGVATLYAAAVVKALGAVDSTYQVDGLTFAKPSYRIKYLMDNVEVRRGFAAAAAIAKSAADANALGAKAARTLNAIDTLLWIPSTGRYAPAMDEAGALSSSPGSWYPDTMAQLMAVAWLPKSVARDALYASVKAASFNVPSTIASAQDGEYAAWWGIAAKGAGDAMGIADAKGRFRSLAFANVILRTPADYAHVISIFVE